jgi:hypothetical protein
MLSTPDSSERTSVMYATHEEQCTLLTKKTLVRQRASDATGDEAGRDLVSVGMVIGVRIQGNGMLNSEDLKDSLKENLSEGDNPGWLRLGCPRWTMAIR